MSQISRYVSAPQLQQVDENTYILVDPCAPSDGDYTEDDDDDASEIDGAKGSTDADNRSASGESANISLLSPEAPAYLSETDTSPALQRKKRRAPLAPNMSPSMAARHSYAFDLNALRNRTSTDTESTTSEPQLFYQTSTDSETLTIPESARGSNFPGELAGIDNLHSHISPRFRTTDDSNLNTSSRGRSRLDRLKDAFRSPQIVRRKTTKEKSGSSTLPRMRKVKADTNLLTMTPKMARVEDRIKFQRARASANYEPVLEISDWNIAAGYKALKPDQEFEVKRIQDYGSYFSQLLEVTSPTDPNYDSFSRILETVRLITMNERENESHKAAEKEGVEAAMEVTEEACLQASFASQLSNNSANSTDDSNNNNKKCSDSQEDGQDVTNKKRKISRRLSAPSAILFKPLSASKTKSYLSLWPGSAIGRNELDLISQYKQSNGRSRMFVMEGAVQFAVGEQIQDRYLFLFNDLLLVAKQKSSTAFRLKNKIQLSDMWIASCMDEVSEIVRPTDRSFVLGWPSTNVVATFPTVEWKDEWLANLSGCITGEKVKDEGRTLQLKVTQHCVPSMSRVCQMTIDNITQVRDVVVACLKQMNIAESEASGYQLWVLTGKEAYPLLGHETPFSIKQSQAREITRSHSSDDLDKMTAPDLDAFIENNDPAQRNCEFHLRLKVASRKDNFDDSTLPKSMKKSKKSPKFINTLLRKIRPAVRPLVFGLPLAEVCGEDNCPPEEIVKLMVVVYQQGPDSPGILRKGNKATLIKEIREKIDQGEKYTLEDGSAFTAASVFKEFLRCIPDGLLLSSLHEQWLNVQKDDPHQEKINKIKMILSKLPATHYHMLKLTICLLQHLAKHSSQNQMSPSNLATCIAPSFFAHGAGESPHGKNKNEAIKQTQMLNPLSEIQNIIAPLIAFMITSHVELFGEDILGMFVQYGCDASPATNFDEEKFEGQIQPLVEEEDEEEDNICDEDYDEFSGQRLKEQHRLQPRRQHNQRDSNSGTDSDSMHSMLSMPETGIGFHRDDSSNDSLGEQEYYTHESEPQAATAHLSPSALSKDSGLTLSDNQLYDEEYQERSSQFAEHRGMDTYDSSFSSHENSAFTSTNYPIAPPRRRSVKRVFGKKTDSGNIGFTTNSSQQTHGNYIIPASYSNIDRFNEPQSNDNRISSDSIGEDENVNNRQRKIDLQRMESTADIGTLMKSESGAHLYLSDETFPTEFSLRLFDNKYDDHYQRCSSASDSTTEASFLPQHSESSCEDSAISDTFSRDGSITSTPQTPDESPDKTLDWMLDIDLPAKPWEKLLIHNTNTQHAQTCSKSALDLPSKNPETQIEDVKFSLDPEEHSLSEKYQMEEMKTRREIHSSFSNRVNEASTDSGYVTSLSTSSAADTPPPSRITSLSTSSAAHAPPSRVTPLPTSSAADTPTSRVTPLPTSSAANAQPLSRVTPLPTSSAANTPPSRVTNLPTSSAAHAPPPSRITPLPTSSAANAPPNRQKYPPHGFTGSPPPNIILQSFQIPPNEDPTTQFTDSTDSTETHSLHSAQQTHFDPKKGMSCIRPEEFVTIKSRPIIITPEDAPSNSSSGVSSKAKLSKYMSPNMNQPLSSKDREFHVKRPEKPPSYQQALQRNFMIKHNVPIDITEKQKEVSARAKAMYEKSLQIYDEQRQAKSSLETKSQASCSNLVHTSEISSIQTESKHQQDYVSNVNSPHKSLHSNNASEKLDSTKNFDMGAISHSLHKDVIQRHHVIAESDASSESRNNPLLRNESKLSNSSSSSDRLAKGSALSRDSRSSSDRLDTGSTLSQDSKSSSDRLDTGSMLSIDSSERLATGSTLSRDFGSWCSESSYSSLAPPSRSSSENRPTIPKSRSDSNFRPQDYEDPGSKTWTNTAEAENAAVDDDDGYVQLRKKTQNMYLKSRQLFEQASSLAPSGVHHQQQRHSYGAAPMSSQHTTAASSLTTPSLPTNTSSHLRVQETRGRSRDTRTSLNLEVPVSNLHRSRSDSSEHVNKLGSYSPHATQTVQGSQNNRIQRSDSSAYAGGKSTAGQSGTMPRDFRSEYQQNFMRAKSSFHQTGSDNSAVSMTAPSSLVHSHSSASSAQESKFSRQQQQIVQPVPINVKTNEPNTSPKSRSKIAPSHPASSVNDSSSSSAKDSFPWSVRNLKSIYDKSDLTETGCMKPGTDSETTSNPSQLSHHDSSHLNRASSMSSSDRAHTPVRRSSSKTSAFNRQGPQSVHERYGSHSSSEESYSSSFEGKSTWSSSCSFDEDEISSYTHVTYI